MQSHRVTGLALIVGALAMFVAIAIHPHQGTVDSGGEMAARHLVVIVIVLVSFGMLGVGFLRLLRSSAPQPWNGVGGVVLVVAGVFGSLAGITGHVVVPRLIAQMNPVDGSEKAMIDVVIANDMALSAALAQTSFAAWAIGVVCLSTSMLHSNSGWKIIGAYGIALGFFILLALGIGRLQISLHNVGLVVLGSGIWLIAIGLGLSTNKSFIDLQPRSMDC